MTSINFLSQLHILSLNIDNLGYHRVPHSSCPRDARDTLVSTGLIAEVILYSEGFESSKNLAQKMTQMYKLCSEQLSQQDHYDFGMRALKSVLVMAGSLKRQNPDKNEDVVLLRALRDSNLPKFLTDDAILFNVRITKCCLTFTLWAKNVPFIFLTVIYKPIFLHIISHCKNQE